MAVRSENVHVAILCSNPRRIRTLRRIRFEPRLNMRTTPHRKAQSRALPSPDAAEDPAEEIPARRPSAPPASENGVILSGSEAEVKSVDGPIDPNLNRGGIPDRSRRRKKRRQSHGSAWHWKQTDSWYYTLPGTKKRVPLLDEDGV